MQQDTWKQLAGYEAAKLVEEGMVIGLGTGSTANHFIYALAQRVQQGLRVVSTVSSSQTSKDLAANLGLPTSDLDTYPTLDLYVDGADEIDDDLRLLKGAGGALLREKIIASASRHFIVIADISKRVTQLGQKFPLPVEAVPFAATPVRKRLEALGATAQIRKIADTIFVTENHNIILDCTFPHGIANPVEVNACIHSIVGVVETGLFLNMAERAIIAGPEGVKVLAGPRSHIL